MLSGAANTSAADGTTVPAVSLKAGGAITLETLPGGPAASVALVYASAGDAVLASGADIEATSSRIISNGELSISAAGTAHLQTAYEPGAGRSDSHGGDWLSRRSSWRVDQGRVLDEEQQGYWVAAGKLNIQAKDVVNDGGRIFSNAGAVQIAASGQVLNRALVAGTAEYRRHCTLFICRTRVSSSEHTVGGEISGATDVSIQAGERIENVGGSVLAIGNLTLQAPQIVARAVTLHQAIARDDGMKAWLGHHWGRLYAFDQGGGFAAQNGRLALLGQGIQDGGSFSGEGASDADIRIVREPTREPVRLTDHLGILRW